MPGAFAERHQEKRETKLERYREQLAAGELVVRQMTESERAYWNEHSAAADRQATPEQRKRRDAAREKRREQADRKRVTDALKRRSSS